VLAGAVLVWLTPAPRRQTGIAALTGARLFKVDAGGVSQLDFRLRDEDASFARRDGAWTADGTPATAGEAAAVDDLVALLVRLRAVDSFRTADLAQFAFDPPQATITLKASGRETVLQVGGFNSTGTTVYGRREGDPRVFQIGTQILSSMQAVLYQRKLAREGKAAAALTVPRSGTPVPPHSARTGTGRAAHRSRAASRARRPSGRTRCGLPAPPPPQG
jgi:hypothetical protein